MAKENQKINQSQQKSQKNPETKSEKRYNGKEATEHAPSPTAYDDACRTLLTTCTRLILFVVNEVFHTCYDGNETVEHLRNEHWKRNGDGEQSKIITDSAVKVTGHDQSERRFHFEFQSTPSGDILHRFMEYDSCIALEYGNLDKDKMVLDVFYPKSSVIFFQKPTKNSPRTLQIRLFVSDGSSVSQNIPALYTQDYDLDEILEKKLYFFYPFHIFRHKENFPDYEENDKKMAEFLKEFRRLRNDVERLVGEGFLKAIEGDTIFEMLLHVLDLIAENHPKVREGVRNIMEGRVIQTKGSQIFDEGEAKGRAEGADEAIIGTIQLFLEDGKSKDEIFARLAKKFHLEQERFEELFQKATENKD